MIFRPVEANDVPALFAVRTATRENAYTLAELHALGITEASVRQRLASTHGGWLSQWGGRVVGFSMANAETGEMWVIAVLPGFEGRGVGARLLALAEAWLWEHGWTEAWLTTAIDPHLRAYGFYRKQGWEDEGVCDGLRYMRKGRPPSAASGPAQAGL